MEKINFGESNKKYTSISDLPIEKKERVEKLEDESEKIYALREEFFISWDRIKDYLKPVEVSDGDKTRKVYLNPRTLIEWDVDSLDDFIDEDKIRERLGAGNSVEVGRHIKRRKAVIKKRLIDLVRMRGELVGGGGEERVEAAKWYEYRIQELMRAQDSVGNFNRQLEDILVEIDLAQQDNDIQTRRESVAEYKDKLADYHKYILHNREAFIAVAYDKLKNMKASFDDQGRIVETPYVKEMMQRVLEVLQTRPIFIHGELGSGKTEFAKHLCRKILSKDYLERWEKGDLSLGLNAHPRPVGKRAVDEWERQRSLEAEPYIISGHKGLEAEQFLGGIKIERRNNLTPEDRVAFKKAQLDVYKKNNPECSEDDLRKLEIAVDQFLNSPVETRGYLGKFYRAMLEGRPIIIDELNAIPHHVLILLNDLLTRKPGDIIKPMVDELPEFMVKPGFCVIATGNWKPEAGGLYVDRQKMDAAFLSRFALEKYDYLPNATDFASLSEANTDEELELKRRANQRNELFQMLLVRLMNKFGGMELPEGGEQQVYRLALVARVLQNVFSGEDVEKTYWPTFRSTETNPKDLLKENVLSLRHLIPIISKWAEDGFSRDLDDYIFLEYVSRSKQHPDEMKYIYQLLQTQGQFFPVDKGWPDATSATELDKLVDFNVIRKIYGVDSMTGQRSMETSEIKMKYYSALETLELLFGPIPKRQAVSEDFFVENERVAEEDPFEAQERAEQRKKIEETISDIKRVLGTNIPQDQNYLKKITTIIEQGGYDGENSSAV